MNIMSTVYIYTSTLIKCMAATGRVHSARYRAAFIDGRKSRAQLTGPLISDSFMPTISKIVDVIPWDVFLERADSERDLF